MDIEIKRAELQTKYNNWIKKNTRRLVISFIAYIVIILINFLLLKKPKITLFSSFLFFTYTVYVLSFIWFIKNKLIANIDSVDFDVK